MGVETATYLGQLISALPTPSDQVALGDDHIRLLKAVLLKTFPGRGTETLKVINKSTTFTPSVNESSVLYRCTAALTVALPAASTAVTGIYWFIQAQTAGTCLTANGAEQVNGATSLLLPLGVWGLLIKSTSSSWVWLAVPYLTAELIRDILGSTAVVKALDADTVDGYHAASFVRTVNGGAPDSGGNVNVGAGYVTLNGVEALTNKTINGIGLSGTAGTTMAFPEESASVGFRNVPQISQSAAYTCVLSDSGKHILHPSSDTTARTFTIPANASVAFPVGTALTFVNQASAGVVTIAITTDTMRLAGAGTTGNRTLAANGIATALKITATEWIISGTGLT